MDARREQELADEVLARRLWMEDLDVALDPPYLGPGRALGFGGDPFDGGPNDVLNALLRGIDGLGLGHDDAYGLNRRRPPVARRRNGLGGEGSPGGPARDYEQYLTRRATRRARRTPHAPEPPQDSAAIDNQLVPTTNQSAGEETDSDSSIDSAASGFRLMRHGFQRFGRADRLDEGDSGQAAARRIRARARVAALQRRATIQNPEELHRPSAAAMAGLDRGDRVGGWLDHVHGAPPRQNVPDVWGFEVRD